MRAWRSTSPMTEQAREFDRAIARIRAIRLMLLRDDYEPPARDRCVFRALAFLDLALIDLREAKSKEL